MNFYKQNNQHYISFLIFSTLAIGTFFFGNFAFADEAPTDILNQSPPKASNLIELKPDQIYDAVGESIFTITAHKLQGSNLSPIQGSAVAVSENLLATNCHVTFKNQALLVTINGNKHLGIVKVKHEKEDLCLVEVDDAKFSPVTIRASNDVRKGEEVYAIGNPIGFEKSITKGIISNKHITNDRLMLQTDAAISPGSSGGGLFDSKANLIGITTSKRIDGESINFAASTELIMQDIQSYNAGVDSDLSLKARKADSSAAKVSNSGVDKYNKILDSTLDKNANAKIYGVYGASKITLFKHKTSGTVGFAIPGRNSSGAVVSYALWTPEDPDVIIIIPFVNNLYSAVDVLNKGMAETNSDLVRMPQVGLFIRSDQYEHVYLTLKNDQFVYYVTQLSDTAYLLKKKSTFILYENYETITDKLTTFGLYGFTEAMHTYKNLKSKR